MSASNKQVGSPGEMLRLAFDEYAGNPEAVVFVADQILCAATQAPKLKFTPTSSGRLGITIGDSEAFEVRLPHDSISSFRTLLARFGVICCAAAEKGSLAGKVKASFKRAGLLADRTVTEAIGGSIEYVSAVVRKEPGSPLYRVDADLDVKRPNGIAAPLHLTMQNETRGLFLLIEPRKANSLPPVRSPH